MREYYFLFILAGIYLVFGTIQDIRKKEVANWLNFSLLAFALAYRLFYSIGTGAYDFFYFGLLGFLVFFLVGNIFYYSKAFGGGDLKLLMALGVILPYSNYADILYVGLGFLFFMFIVGTIYTIIVAIAIALRNWDKFRKEFLGRLKLRIVLFELVILVIGIFVLFFDMFFGLIILLLFLFFFLFIFLKSVDQIMIREKSWKELCEGDWLERDVKVGNRWIRKSVHGLSKEDIILIKKYKKKVLIKDGIAYLPAIFISFVLMALFFLVLRPDFQEILKSFLSL